MCRWNALHVRENKNLFKGQKSKDGVILHVVLHLSLILDMVERQLDLAILAKLMAPCQGW